MASDHRLSSAATPDGLDKAFASAKKALSITGIDMSVKKPDAAKVSAKMTKTGEPAVFLLSCSGGKVFLTVECDGAEVAELGQMSLDIAKRGKEALAELDALVELKLMSKAEAEKLRAGARTGPDPKVAANELRKKIAELKKEIADLEKEMAADASIKTFDDAKRDKIFFAGLVALCKAEHSTEGLDFITAVEKKVQREKIIEQFIGKKAKNEVNISDFIEKDIRAGGNFDQAVETVEGLIVKDTMARYKNNLAKEHEKKINPLKAELKALEG